MMISAGDALQCVLRDLPHLDAERVALTQARGRVLAQPVCAPRDVPAFRNSAMDGYAVRSIDVAGASPERPVHLRVLETVAAGIVPARVVQAETATRIMTGAAMPEGADAVVPVENTAFEDDIVAVRVPSQPGEAIRNAGEDFRAGTAVFQPGRLLRPADIGVLASVGTTMLRVVRRPRVAILATGDELVDIGQPQGPGQIVNSNEYALAAAVEEAGGEPIRLGIVRDQREDLNRAFQEAFTANLVLSTGGVSMGTFDYVRARLRDLGYQERFWKVAQKPGKPLTFGFRDGTPAFGLPGNPVSALVCFYLYVLPAMRTMTGMAEVYLPCTEAALAEPLVKRAGLTEFVRCIIEGPPADRRARSTGTQSSGVLSSVSTGHGLIVTPQDAAVVEAGTKVKVVLLKPDAGSPEAPF
jgi:molybdopterin molybdotransferase